MRISIKTFSLSLLLLSLMMAGNATAIVFTGFMPPGSIGFPYENAVRVGGASGVYVGNGWVLTAAHLPPTDINVQGTTYYYDGTNSFKIKNPTGYEGVDSTYTDLRLFRLTEKPDLPEIQLSTQSPSRGSIIYYAGFGGVGTGEMLYWTKQGDYEWVESETATYYWGYQVTSSTNVSFGYDITTSDGSGPTPDTNITTLGTTDLIALRTTFTNQVGDTQAVGGDSGSPVFYNDPEDGWVLAGIVSCIATYPNAPTQAFADSVTYSVDLSFYLDEINYIISPIPGDANRDGIVNGSDATILADHWQESTYLGSTVGDFNEDGIVDGSDATILAANWQEEGDASWADAVVPEPSVWIMLLGSMMAICHFFRKILMA